MTVATPTASQDAPPNAAGTPLAATQIAEGLKANVEEIVRLEQRDRLTMSRSDRIANWFATFSGRMSFLILHAVWFVVWIVWNAGWIGIAPFDAYPFGLLTVMVSLEAIFLSTFVLISQNRQALAADRRAKVDLQINLLTEQETTRILTLVTEINRHLNLSADEIAAEQPHVLEQPTDIGEVMDTTDTLEQKLEPKGAAGPQSAADTDA